MPEQEPELVRIPLPKEGTEALTEIVLKHAKTDGSFAIVQEGERAFLHVSVPKSAGLSKALEMHGIRHAVIPPLRLDVHALGLSERAFALTQRLLAGGVVLAGITSDGVQGQQKTDNETVLRSTTESCAKMEEVASGYASGVKGEVTVIGDLDPSTYEAAINDAYANALAAAAKESARFDTGSCEEPCVCRYSVTFTPEASHTTSVLEIKVSAAGQQAAVSVSAEGGGSYKTVTAWIRWTLWRVCISGNEANGTPTASSQTGSVTLGGQTMSHPCPTRSERGEVRLREDWTWSISSLSDPFSSQPDDPNRALLLARDAIRQRVIGDCVKAASAALHQLETCPSHCPKIGDSSVLFRPPVVTVSPHRHVTGIASIYYEVTLTATGGWAVFRPCCPAE